MGETRVDLHHLLEDLRDAYPGDLEETILTEILANALDSGARTVRFRCDPASATFTALDDGCGMKRRDLARYHDIASSTKTRGQGIGFAGVGIKLALLVSEHVVTETRRGTSHVASQWHLGSRHKAPWKWVEPQGLVGEQGTAVQIRLVNPLSPLVDAGFVEGVVRRHFDPLLDPAFAPLLGEHYGEGVRFHVNDREVHHDEDDAGERVPIEIRIGRKRKPSAIGFLARYRVPVPEDRRGVAVSTLGKVIKRGWDWLGVTPVTPDRIGGMIEVPALAECLTLNKADFIRSGQRGATFLGFRKAIQEVVSRQLEQWGDARDGADDTRRRAARPVERDLERVLVDLADDFPLLATLVERRQGGQRRLPIGMPAADGRDIVATSVFGAQGAEGALSSERMADSEPEATAGLAAAAIQSPATAAIAEPLAGGSTEPEPAAGTTESMAGITRRKTPARYGLQIQFESGEESGDLARLVESTVWINESHPAYVRAVASRSEGYHLAVGVAMALAPLAVEPAQERTFVSTFLERWGGALSGGTPRRRRRTR